LPLQLLLPFLFVIPARESAVAFALAFLSVIPAGNLLFMPERHRRGVALPHHKNFANTLDTPIGPI
jgi:hypothetical protein